MKSGLKNVVVGRVKLCSHAEFAWYGRVAVVSKGSTGKVEFRIFVYRPARHYRFSFNLIYYLKASIYWFEYIWSNKAV